MRRSAGAKLVESDFGLRGYRLFCLLRRRRGFGDGVAAPPATARKKSSSVGGPNGRDFRMSYPCARNARASLFLAADAPAA